MKSLVIATMVATLSCAGLCTGCASVATSSTRYDDVDTAKVASVDRMAKSHGILLQWVNYPQRKDAGVAAAPPTVPTGT